MILVDTSVWIDHLRQGKPVLADALDTGQVMMHPLVLGELACGNLANRRVILDLLAALPVSPTAEHEDVLSFVDTHGLLAGGWDGLMYIFWYRRSWAGVAY